MHSIDEICILFILETLDMSVWFQLVLCLAFSTVLLDPQPPLQLQQQGTIQHQSAAWTVKEQKLTDEVIPLFTLLSPFVSISKLIIYYKNVS